MQVIAFPPEGEGTKVLCSGNMNQSEIFYIFIFGCLHNVDRVCNIGLTIS